MLLLIYHIDYCKKLVRKTVLKHRMDKRDCYYISDSTMKESRSESTRLIEMNILARAYIEKYIIIRPTLYVSVVLHSENMEYNIFTHTK